MLNLNFNFNLVKKVFYNSFSHENYIDVRYIFVPFYNIVTIQTHYTIYIIYKFAF